MEHPTAADPVTHADVLAAIRGTADQFALGRINSADAITRIDKLLQPYRPQPPRDGIRYISRVDVRPNPDDCLAYLDSGERLGGLIKFQPGRVEVDSLPTITLEAYITEGGGK